MKIFENKNLDIIHTTKQAQIFFSWMFKYKYIFILICIIMGFVLSCKNNFSVESFLGYSIAFFLYILTGCFFFCSACLSSVFYDFSRKETSKFFHNYEVVDDGEKYIVQSGVKNFFSIIISCVVSILTFIVIMIPIIAITQIPFIHKHFTYFIHD